MCVTLWRTSNVRKAGAGEYLDILGPYNIIIVNWSFKIKTDLTLRCCFLPTVESDIQEINMSPIMDFLLKSHCTNKMVDIFYKWTFFICVSHNWWYQYNLFHGYCCCCIYIWLKKYNLFKSTNTSLLFRSFINVKSNYKEKYR